MDGPSFAPIIIPLVVTPVLAFWLIMVYWAAAHPAHKPGRPAAGRPGAAGEVEVRSKDRTAVPAEPDRAPEPDRTHGWARVARGHAKRDPDDQEMRTWAMAAPGGAGSDVGEVAAGRAPRALAQARLARDPAAPAGCG